MGIFDVLESFKKLADDPNLAASAAAIGKAANELMPMLERIAGTLERIEAGIDAVSDPVKRPPFTPADIEAAIKNEWPFDPHRVYAEPEWPPKPPEALADPDPHGVRVVGADTYSETKDLTNGTGTGQW